VGSNFDVLSARCISIIAIGLSEGLSSLLLWRNVGNHVLCLLGLDSECMSDICVVICRHAPRQQGRTSQLLACNTQTEDDREGIFVARKILRHVVRHIAKRYLWLQNRCIRGRINT
jgi:hypothetical protein